MVPLTQCILELLGSNKVIKRMHQPSRVVTEQNSTSYVSKQNCSERQVTPLTEWRRQHLYQKHQTRVQLKSSINCLGIMGSIGCLENFGINYSGTNSLFCGLLACRNCRWLLRFWCVIWCYQLHSKPYFDLILHFGTLL